MFNYFINEKRLFSELKKQNRVIFLRNTTLSTNLFIHYTLSHSFVFFKNSCFIMKITKYLCICTDVDTMFNFIEIFPSITVYI